MTSRALIVAGLLIFIGSGLSAPDAAGQEPGEDAAESGPGTENSTVIYDREYIARFPNAVSVLDIIERIPGGTQILGPERRGNGPGQRGFSSSDDRVLIDGKRLSGKDNDSRSALARITVDQVERIELIRGSSPDIKTSSQQAIINIVLFEGATQASGSWRFNGRYNRLKRFHPGGFLSYGGARGAFDYFVSAEVSPRSRKQNLTESIFDAADSLVTRQREILVRDHSEITLSGNFGYTFAGGAILRVNGQVEYETPDERQPGTLFAPVGDGGFEPISNNLRTTADDNFSWEIGGDSEIPVWDNASLKLLWLRGERDRENLQAEDFDFAGDPAENDIISTLDALSTETIGRASLTFPALGGEMEVGSELAFNKLDSRFAQEERIGGVLLPVDVETGATVVKETRDESFLIYTRPLSPKSSIEASLFVEISKITQRDETGRLSRNFTFFRPSVDYRYNFTPRDQFQASIRREVGQLNFDDFASSANQDDDITQGNRDIEPETSWQVELSFEHRLKEDAGSVKIRGVYRRFDNKLQQVEVSPGVSGIGNTGRARAMGLEFTGNLRFGFIGLPDLLVEVQGLIRDTSVKDDFTGKRRFFDDQERNRTGVTLRHDLTDIGVSYGAIYVREGKQTFRDFNEVTIFKHPRHDLDVFVQMNILDGIILKLSGQNLANRDFGRNRFLFDAGVASGVLTSRELRDRPGGRTLAIELSGTF